MLIDTHCHIDAPRFNDDRPAVLSRARAAGVARFVTIGCDVQSSERALGLAQTHDDVRCSVGVHPHEAAAAGPGYMRRLRELQAHPRVVAIGECGLDYYYDHSPREVQRRVFAEQIALAMEVDKPLVVHVRDAWEDCLSLLEEHRPKRGVIHCFTAGWAEAERALALGFFISIPGVVTFKKAGDLPEVVPKVPLDRLLVETDSPYLAPAPYRGKRNEPAYVRHVAEKVAELRDMSVESLIEATGENAKALFSWA